MKSIVKLTCVSVVLAIGCGRAPERGLTPEVSKVANIRTALVGSGGEGGAAEQASTSTGWGTLKGRLVYDGDPPELPPMNEAEWNRLYELYRTIPQYELVNQGFGLEGFKGIFWLEWTHRLWGRLIGLAYFAGLVWFWVRGRIPPGAKPRLLGLLALGGLQGAVGWYMVASGFEADRTAVSPYRLVIHLGLALLIYAALLNIPEEVIEAAECDGVTGWAQFFKIKLPLILPAIGIISILTFVGNFNAFDLIYSAQGALAGPNYSTDILGTFLYRTFFGFQLQTGDPYMGSAIASMMFLIILTGVCIYLFTIQTRLRRYQF